MTTLKDYRPEVRSLFATLKRHGFTIRSYFDGEELVPATAPDFVEAVCAVEEGILHVTRKGLKESVKTPGKMVLRAYGLALVFGNGPGELVADWTVPKHDEDRDALEAATNEHFDRWDKRKQPVTTLES